MSPGEFFSNAITLSVVSKACCSMFVCFVSRCALTNICIHIPLAIEKNKITVSKKLIPKKDNKFACTISSKETFTLGFSNTLIVAVGAGFSFNHRYAGVLENTKANFEFYAFFFNKINPYIQEVFDSLYLNSLRTRPPPMV